MSFFRSQYESFYQTDPQFLLRCALTHDWEHVESYCRYIGNRENTDIILQQTDQYGNSVLQAACYFLPPISAVTAILNIANGFDIKSCIAKDGSTALQTACAVGASSGIIRLICAPHLVDRPDQQNSTPVTDLVVQYRLARKQAQQQARSSVPPALESIGNIEAACRDSPVFGEFWTKLTILLGSVYPHSMLHAAASIAHAIPNVLVDLLLLLRCTADCRKISRRGLLPLHWALVRDDDMVAIHNSHRQLYFVHALLDAYPAAVLVRLPDGKLPIFHGIRERAPMAVLKRLFVHNARHDGLAPFQCAAVVDRDLTIIYELLLLEPQRVKF